MARVLILYTTVEGHTTRVVERIASVLRDRGHDVGIHRMQGASSTPEPADHEAVIVGSSIHYGRHPRFLRQWVRRRREALTARPAAFFSVSLTAGGPGARPEEAQKNLDRFLDAVDWRPSQTAMFAGALQYSQYPFWKRWMMRAIVGGAGGDTDTSRDYVYTDWSAVDDFTDAFARRV